MSFIISLMFVLATLDIDPILKADMQKRTIRKAFRVIILVLNEPNDIEISLCTTA
jgi:hypothetical protein